MDQIQDLADPRPGDMAQRCQGAVTFHRIAADRCCNEQSQTLARRQLADRATRQDQTQDGERTYQELTDIRIIDRGVLDRSATVS
jgi:hypothetical protein